MIDKLFSKLGIGVVGTTVILAIAMWYLRGAWPSPQTTSVGKGPSLTAPPMVDRTAGSLSLPAGAATSSAPSALKPDVATEVYRKADAIRHRESLPAGGDARLQLADQAIRYVVGSGNHAISYLVESADGFLAESPISWYASLNGWGLSPGYETYNTSFARPVYADCVACHAGRVEAVGGNRSRVAVHSMLIDCERCHGPGSLHVDHHHSTPDAAADIDLTIVNPDHLPRAQGEAVCWQCHLDSAADVDLRGRTARDFRPGQWMEDFRIHYALQVPNVAMKVAGHVEQLHLSNCYRGSETLTCTTCHSPHPAAGIEQASAENRLEFFRSKCLSCHEQSCGLPQAERLQKSPEDNCMTCHMPTSRTDLLHVAATHHRIGIHSANTKSSDGLAVGDLVPLGDLSHLPKINWTAAWG